MHPVKIDEEREELLDLPPKIDEDIAPKKVKERPKSYRRSSLKLRIQGSLGVIGKALAAFNEYDAKVILDNADELSNVLDQWAKENDRVRRTLEAALTVSTTGSVLGVLAAILIPILANHGIVPFHYAEAIGGDPVPNPERFFKEILEGEEGEVVTIMSEETENVGTS